METVNCNYLKVAVNVFFFLEYVKCCITVQLETGKLDNLIKLVVCNNVKDSSKVVKELSDTLYCTLYCSGHKTGHCIKCPDYYVCCIVTVF